MELNIQKAKEILEMLDIKFLPKNGKAIEQAQKALEERGFTLKDDGKVYRNLIQEDFDLNPEFATEGLKIGDEVGLGELKSADNSKQNPPAKSNKDKSSVVMKENVLHDGERYEKGKTYEVNKEIKEVFTKKKFVEVQ